VHELGEQLGLHTERFLRQALELRMTEIHGRRPSHRRAIDALAPRVVGALAGPSFWRAFARDALIARIPELTAWLLTTGAVVDAQLHRRGFSIRPRSMPLTTAPMDGQILPIRDAITPRRGGFKNPQRLNHLLMLMQLHANRQADEGAYATTIRAWLEAHHGQSDVDRRALADVKRIGSL